MPKNLPAKAILPIKYRKENFPRDFQDLICDLLLKLAGKKGFPGGIIAFSSA
ncbi:MAG: hypothetical protein METHP_01717 [Methanoregula sp. SKADARSKE-2]|jgi:hypothetical protein|nr:MAG: hypothetical protein METHP_01717 [Methanoregula sp. SKADARSKE-2]